MLLAKLVTTQIHNVAPERTQQPDWAERKHLQWNNWIGGRGEEVINYAKMAIIAQILWCLHFSVLSVIYKSYGGVLMMSFDIVNDFLLI